MAWKLVQKYSDAGSNFCTRFFFLVISSPLKGITIIIIYFIYYITVQKQILFEILTYTSFKIVEL